MKSRFRSGRGIGATPDTVRDAASGRDQARRRHGIRHNIRRGPDSDTGHRSGRVTGQSCVRQDRFPPRRPHADPSFDPDIQHALVPAPQDRRADFHPEFPIRPEFGHHVKQLCREHSHNIGVFTHPARCRAQEQASKQRLYSRPAHTISPRTPSSSSIFTKNRSKSPSAASNRLR